MELQAIWVYSINIRLVVRGKEEIIYIFAHYLMIKYIN